MQLVEQNNVGYYTGYSQLGTTLHVGYLPSHVQRVLME